MDNPTVLYTPPPHPTEGLTDAALRARRDLILQSFADGTAPVTDELIEELAEINAALGEAGFVNLPFTESP